MKELILLTLLLSYGVTNAQSVKHNDKYGRDIVFVDGATLKAKDKYGDKLYYLDGQTIRRKDKYGDAVYFIDVLVMAFS